VSAHHPQGPNRRGETGPVFWEDLTAYRRPGLLTLAWRWRTELIVFATGIAGWLIVRELIGATAATVSGLIALSLLLAVPGPRRWTIRRIACVLTRHRLYAVFRESRATTRTGRLPLVMRVRPTPAGERALVWCRAGVCAEDLAGITDHLRAACFAQEVYVEPSARWSHLVTLHVVRLDRRALRVVAELSEAGTESRGSRRKDETDDWAPV